MTKPRRRAPSPYSKDVVKTRMQAGVSNGASAAAAMPNMAQRSGPSSAGMSAMKAIHQRASTAANGAAAAVSAARDRCVRCGLVLHNGLVDVPANRCGSPRLAAILNRPISWAGCKTPSDSLTSALWQIGRTEGLAGLYSGLAPTLLMAVPQTVLYFSMYDVIRDELRRHRSLPAGDILAPMIAGGSARLLAATAISPLELIRTQMQSQLEQHRQTLREAFVSTCRETGVRGLWRGLGPTLWRDVPFSMTYWFGYDLITRRLAAAAAAATASAGLGGRAAAVDGGANSISGEGAIMRAFVGGAGAGSLATVLTHPFDVLKTRQQVVLEEAGGAMAAAGRSSLQQLAGLYRTEGVRGLYMGLGPRLLRVGPACAIMISCYEGGKLFFAERERQGGWLLAQEASASVTATTAAGGAPKPAPSSAAVTASAVAPTGQPLLLRWRG